MDQHKRAHVLCALFAIVAMLLLGGGALTLWQLPALELAPRAGAGRPQGWRITGSICAMAL